MDRWIETMAETDFHGQTQLSLEITLVTIID
jgi:hypothetical protein